MKILLFVIALSFTQTQVEHIAFWVTVFHRSCSHCAHFVNPGISRILKLVYTVYSIHAVLYGSMLFRTFQYSAASLLLLNVVESMQGQSNAVFCLTLNSDTGMWCL